MTYDIPTWLQIILSIMVLYGLYKTGQFADKPHPGSGWVGHDSGDV